MRGLVLGIVFLSLIPLVAAGPGGVNCNVRTSFSVEVGSFHLFVPTSGPVPPAEHPELWQESNGIDGLQRSRSYCTDGPYIPADICITHTAHWHALNCVMGYPGPEI